MINVLLFAHLQEAIGDQSISIDRHDITVSELKKEMEAKYGLNLSSTMVAVNEEFVDDDFLIKQGNTVALIPPVSGG